MSEKTRQTDTIANVRAALIAMLIATAMMALMNSGELASYSRDLPGNRLSDELVFRADQWHDAMTATGPGRVRPWLREHFEAVRETRW